MSWTKSFLVGVLFLFVTGAAASALLDKNKVMYAISCGADRPFMSEHGYEYQADKYFKNGQIADYPNNHPNLPAEGIRYTKDKQLHQRERYSTTGWLDYELPVSEDGNYVLILHFCELNFNNVNQRVVHIFLGDTVVRPNHDTVRGGSKAQVSVYIPFSVKNNRVVYLKDLECENALTSGRAVRLRFKAVYDNPKVDGIVLFKGSLEETNFFNLDESRRENDRRSSSSSKAKEQLRDQMMEGYMRKQRMRKVKRHDIDEFEEYEKEYIEIDDSEGGMGRKLGLAVLLVLMASGYFGYKKQVSKQDTNAEDAPVHDESQTSTSKSPAKSGKGSKTAAVSQEVTKPSGKSSAPEVSKTEKTSDSQNPQKGGQTAQTESPTAETETQPVDRKKTPGKKK